MPRWANRSRMDSRRTRWGENACWRNIRILAKAHESARRSVQAGAGGLTGAEDETATDCGRDEVGNRLCGRGGCATFCAPKEVRLWGKGGCTTIWGATGARDMGGGGIEGKVACVLCLITFVVRISNSCALLLWDSWWTWTFEPWIGLFWIESIKFWVTKPCVGTIELWAGVFCIAKGRTWSAREVPWNQNQTEAVLQQVFLEDLKNLLWL